VMERRPIVLHFVPYASDEMLRKSLVLKADALVLDLEDSVTPDNKESARTTVTEWLRRVDFPRQKRLVRINALDSEWGRADVESTMAGRPDGFLVPKAGDLTALRELDSFISLLEKLHGYPERGIELLPIIETPKGALHVNEVALSPRVTAICGGRGGLDMAAALGAWRVRDQHGELLDMFRLAGMMCLLAAAAADVQPIDSVLLLGDLERMQRECRESAEMGYTGWITIHPSQIDVVHQTCFPSDDQINESRELVAAFEEHRKLGKWAFRFRGQMVDVPNLKRAQTILERARLKLEVEAEWREEQ
jgi:citrate lyase subunit beta / citryl-CoA lyase